MGTAAGQQVYFLKPVGHAGPIKIGVSNNADGRLATYAAWSPLPLELLATVPGSFALERNLHEVFAHAHSHLEWFHPVDELLRGIHALQRGVPVEQAFDLSNRTGSIFHTARRKARFTPQYRERLGFNQRFSRKGVALYRKGFKDFDFSAAARGVLHPSVSQQPLTSEERAALIAELQHADKLLSSA